jgi:hypothetical protein
MKKINCFSWVNALVGIALTAILFAFTTSPGAHSVQVYLDNKLVIDHYIQPKEDAPKVTLDAAEKYSQLIVKYSECGRTVTGRKITMKDDNNKVLKEWKFAGSSKGFEEPMQCSIKDIVALKQKGNNTLKVYYSSNDFPDGHQIANLVLKGNGTTASE